MAKTNDSQKPELPEAGKILEPPHNLYLARRVNSVKCRVDLYKVPPQCVNFEPTKTHFYLDTFKFSKKYRLEVPYPEGVEVDTNVEATFDRGVLTCDLPILSDPNKPAHHDEMVEAREQIREMRKKGIPVPIELEAKAQLAKSKVKESSTPAPSTPSKKGKAPLSNKEKRQLEKAKRERELEEDPTAPKKKKKKTEKKKESTPNKSFLEDSSVALSMADAVNDQQEKAIKDKMDREYAKLSVDTRKKIERQEKKAQLRAIRKQEAESLDEKKPKKESQFKKSTSKVSFA